MDEVGHLGNEGLRDVAVDHITEISEGGEIGNLVLLDQLAPNLHFVAFFAQLRLPSDWGC